MPQLHAVPIFTSTENVTVGAQAVSVHCVLGGGEQISCFLDIILDIKWGYNMNCGQLRSIKCPLLSLYQYFSRHVAYIVL